MAEPLTWLLKLDSDVGGATAFNKKLAETEAKLGATDSATTKTERKIESLGQKSNKMAKDVAAASAAYVGSLISAGVPMERIEHLGNLLNGVGGAGADGGKTHRESGKGAGEHADELQRLRATLSDLKQPGEIEKLKHQIANFGKEAGGALDHVAQGHKASAHAASEHAAKTHEATGAAAQFRNVLRDATKVVGFKELSKAIDETKHNWTGMAEFAVGVLAFEGIKTGIELVSELGREIVKAAAQEERTGKVFENILGEQGGKDAQEYAEQYARNTEFSKEQTEGFATELLRAGVPLSKLDEYMAAAGDVAASSKNKLEGMTSAVAALGRATMSGKLEGRALRGLSLGLPQMRDLAEFKGKSDDELKGILEDGELTTNQVMRMIAGRDNVVGDKAVEMSKTLGAKLAHVGELPDRYFEKFADSPALEKMKGALDHILDGLDPNKEPGAGIFAALDSAVSGIAGFVGEIDFEHVGEVIRDDVIPAAKTFFGFMKSTAEVIEQMVAGYKFLTGQDKVDAANARIDKTFKSKWGTEEKDDLDFLDAKKFKGAKHDYMSHDGPALAATVAPPSANEVLLGGIARRSGVSGEAAAADPGSLAERSLAGIDREAPGFERKGIDAAAGFADGMRGSDKPAQAGADMGMSALDGLSSPAGQDSHSPSRKFARLGGFAADGYVDGIEDGEERAIRAAMGLGAAAAGAGAGGDTDQSQPLFGRPRAGAPSGAPDEQPAQRQQSAPAVERKIEINITVPISMGGSPRPREVDDMIAKLRATLPGTLQAAVEALAIEGGV